MAEIGTTAEASQGSVWFDIEEVEGQRKGSVNYIVNEYRMRRANERKNAKTVPLKCVDHGSKDHCPCRGSWDTVRNKAKITIEHNHPPHNISAHVLKREIFNRAENAVTENLNDIFCEMTRHHPAGIDITYKMCEPTMSKRRRLNLPNIPSTISEFIEVLKDNPEGLGMHFLASLEIDSKEFGAIFANRMLMKEASEYHAENFISADGTFFVIPKRPDFYQLFTIHIVIDHHFYPVFSVLMDGKTEQKYTKAFEKLKEFVPNLNPVIAMTDHEQASRNALKAIWKDIVVKLCYFHFSQSIFRNVQTNGLTTKYESIVQFKKWIKKIMSLVLLPAEHIVPTFETLLLQTFDFNVTDTALLVRFKKYLKSYWLKYAKKDPKMLSVFGRDSATNNGAESFHSKLKRRMPKGNTPAWTFVQKLGDVLDDSYNDFLRMKMHGSDKVYRERRKETVKNIAHRRDMEQKLLLGECSPIEFLEAVSYTNSKLIQKLQRQFRSNPNMWDEVPEEDFSDLIEEEENENQAQFNNNAEMERPMCTICHGERSEERGMILPCTHNSFCASCLDICLELKRQCPLCRGPVDKNITFKDSN